MKETAVIRGTVVAGRSLGHTLGFPTANVRIAGNCGGIRNGVWFAEVETEDDGGRYFALVNIGTRPTVGQGLEPLAEAYLIGFEGTLYGTTIRIGLLEYMRAERKFDSLDELRQAMGNDLKQAEKLIHEYDSGL